MNFILLLALWVGGGEMYNIIILLLLLSVACLPAWMFGSS